MRVRPLQPDRYRLDYAELCEAGFRLLERTYPLVVDVLEYFEFALRRRPAEAGEPCLAFVDQGRDLRLLMTPATPNYPSLRVLFEITERRDYVWHVSAADPA